MERLQDNEVEIMDLEPLGNANINTRPWLATIVLDWQCALQSKRSRRHWRVGSLMGLLVLLVILFALNGSFIFMVNRFSTPSVQGASASSSLAAMPPLSRVERIACLADAVQSPDEHFIAVLGYQDCPNPKDSYVAGLLNLYDACSGQLIRQLHPDGAIVRRFNESLPPRVRYAVQKDKSSPPVIIYKQVRWSPDSQYLAFTFALAAQQPPLRGVLVMDRDGGSQQVVLQPPPASGPFSLKWDLIPYPIVRPVFDRRTLPQNLC